MASAAPTRKQVAESAFELLMMEAVQSLRRLHPKVEDADLIAFKLEELGFRAGERFAERFDFRVLYFSASFGYLLMVFFIVSRMTRDLNRFSEELETVKYLCKELWTEAFKKQADKLQTNHKGIYVLHDLNFRYLQRISSATSMPEEGLLYTHFPAGLIRGMLQSFGIKASVRAEIPSLPKCTILFLLNVIDSHILSILFDLDHHNFILIFYFLSGSFTINVTKAMQPQQ
jgi:hypothetical protein